MTLRRLPFLVAAMLLLAGFAFAQTPAITALNPASAAVGTPGLTLTVVGSNFRTGSTVFWNSSPLVTAVNSITQLTASVPGVYLRAAGTATVTVLNPGGLTSNSVTFRIGSQIQVTTADLAPAAVGTPYSAILTASNGTAPYTWSAIGALPPGLSLSPTGVISGTPSIAGRFEFTVQASDATGQSGTRALVLTVALPQFSITTASPLPNAAAGQAYSVSLAAAGGTPPYRWTASQGLPPGLQIDTARGAIRGTPASAGAFNFVVQIQDSAGATATKNFSLAVMPAPLSITTVSPLFAGSVGVAYAQTFSAAGGVPPYRWTVISGDTGGLTLEAAQGTLQGIPSAAGSYSFTVQVADNTGATSSRAFSFIVNPPSLTITTGSTLPAGSVGAAYSHTFTVTGGMTPYTWATVNGSVPGLILEPAGILSGTPSSPGTFTLTLQARDSAGVTASRTFAIAIGAAALGISSASDLPDAMLSEPFLHAMTAAGGAPPYTWTANGLPDGVSIDTATGVISGTPAAAGSYSFTVRVTDSARATFVDLFRLRVNLPPAPPARISGLPQTAQPADQMTLRVALESRYPAPITGQAVLTFAPDSGGGDSTIQFASGGRTANFTVPADALDATSTAPLAIQTGTVAGTITVSLRLLAGGIDITPSPAPSERVRIERAAPVARSARMVRSGNTITVEVSGFSTAREVTQMAVTFAAASGQTLQNSTVTVPVETLFTQWFHDPASSQYGSQFFFSQPFTITGDANAVNAERLTLTNRVGSVTVDIQR